MNQMKKYDQISFVKCLTKHGGLDLYYEDTKNRFTIDYEDINFSRKKSDILLDVLTNLMSFLHIIGNSPFMMIFSIELWTRTRMQV